MDSLPPQEPHGSNLPASRTASPQWHTPDFMAREVNANLEWSWTPRTPISQRTRETASAWLRAHDAWIRPASSEGISRWLEALGVQCASQMPAEEAMMRAAAYVTTLADRPGYWFTKATLKAAAENFKWLPSVAELVDFLKKQTQDRAAQVEGARRIVNGPSRQPETVRGLEPLGVRLQAIAESYLKHYGPDDPRTKRAQARLDQ